MALVSFIVSGVIESSFTPLSFCNITQQAAVL